MAAACITISRSTALWSLKEDYFSSLNAQGEVGVRGGGLTPGLEWLNIKQFVLCGCSNWSVSHQVLGLPPSLCCVCCTLTSPTGLGFTVHGPHTIGLRLPGHWGKLTIYDVGAQVQVTPDPWSGLMNPSFPLMLRSFKLVKVSLIIISGSLWVSDFWDFVIEHWFLEKEQCFQCACACLCVW